MRALGTYTYGPVPSRRLGRSLGVDLVPFKTCTYDCVYCQLGRTTNLTLERAEYVPAGEVVDEVRAVLDSGAHPDVITLAGSGEPTLHARIGEIIDGIKGITDVPVAVLTNGSLLWMPQVAQELARADLVVPSLDAGDERTFQLVNRPHPELGFEQMVDGLASFAAGYRGRLWLEVLLVAGTTGTPAHVARIARLVERVKPDLVHLNTASRPPAESGVLPVPAEELESLRSLFPCPVEVVAESLEPGVVGEDDARAADERVLALLRRRPCTTADIATGLGAHAADVVKVVESLRARGAVTTITRDGRTYFAPAHSDRDVSSQ